MRRKFAWLAALFMMLNVGAVMTGCAPEAEEAEEVEAEDNGEYEDDD